MTISPSDVVDVVVVGAGPAGLASATAAGTRGASVALVDAGVAPGGQYWRHPATARLGRVETQGVDEESLAHLHHGLRDYRRLVDLLAGHVDAGTTRYLSQHHVWTIERDDDGFAVHAVDRSGPSERAVEVRGRRLVLAPGAYDRQVPFPGWTLPGVMTAGGAQALLKGNGVVAGARVVVAGTGPFLLPVAAGLAKAGADVVGVHEAASARAWLRHTGAVLRNANKLGEGLGYARALARHKVPVKSRSVLVAAHGGERLTAVTVARAGRDGVVPGTEQLIECDTLAVGWGFTPQLELPLELGCETRVDTDGSLVCVVDDDQQGSVPGVFVAGEAGGVGGAVLALVEGAIAGAAASGVPVRDARLKRQRSALRWFAAAMHTAHPVPSGWTARLTDDTIVCRCEEVSAARLLAAVGAGASDARAAKLMARPGMGWCQGRVCGYATTCLTAAWSGAPYRPELTGSRPVAAPLTLGTLGEASTGGTYRPEA
jgi:NADPH-dependent 2,4-dienoyl-CoA reductase/sulfur reductase-like enzyme